MGRPWGFAVRDREVFDPCVYVSKGDCIFVTGPVLNSSFTEQVPVTQSKKALGVSESISSHRQVAFIDPQVDAARRGDAH